MTKSKEKKPSIKEITSILQNKLYDEIEDISDEDLREILYLTYMDGVIKSQLKRRKLRQEIEEKSELLIDLEADFKKEYNSHQKQIDSMLEKAKKEFNKAIEFSNERGIPFRTNIGYMRPIMYVPHSYNVTYQKMVEIANIKEYDILKSIIPYCDQNYSFWTESSTHC